MSALQAYVRRIGAAIAMAALAAFVMHNAMPGHAHASGTGAAAAKVVVDEGRSHVGHTHDHAASDHHHAGADVGVTKGDGDALAHCDSACCGVACAAAMPAAPAGGLAASMRWSSAQWPPFALQSGIPPEGLRRPPRPSGMT